MEYGFWIALCLGGLFIAGMSAIHQMMTIKESGEQFRVKPILRDFLLGAFISAFLYHLMPDTVLSLLESGKTTLGQLQKGGGSTIDPMTDIDLHVGPARF